MFEVAQKQIPLHESAYPETLTILDYWNDKRAGRLAPAWTDVDLMDLPLSLIPHMVVVDVIVDPLDFRYRFWGGWHVQYHGYDQTNKFMSGIEPPPYREQIINQCRQILDQPEPQLFVQQIPIKGDLWVYSELCRFPLSDDGETVTKILSAEFSVGDFRDVHEYFSSARNRPPV